MPEEEGISGEKWPTRRAELDEEALFFLKCMTMRGIGGHKLLPGNSMQLNEGNQSEMKVVDEESVIHDYTWETT